MKTKKMILMFISFSLLLIGLVSITYGFFNYTRTGSLNNLGTGRIYFNSTQNGSLNLTNIFPMTSSDAGNANLDTVTVGIQGDTTYTDGEEFEITIVDVNNTVNGKSIPINYIATYEATTGNTIGTSNDTYWESRESKNADIYLLNETGKVEEGKQVLVGYIKNDNTGINGTLTIKAYIDADRIAITDTPEENTEWQQGRTVLTTTEWNNFQNSETPISFKIRAESNEGIWVEQEATPANYFNTRYGIISATYNTNRTNEDIANCVTYFTNLGLNDFLQEGESLESLCSDTGTIGGHTIQTAIDGGMFSNLQLQELNETKIITINEGIIITNYNSEGGSDVVIPSRLPNTLYTYNSSRTNEDITSCINYLTDLDMNRFLRDGESIESFCSGSGTAIGYSIYEWLLDDKFSIYDLQYLSSINIISITYSNETYPVKVIDSNAFANKALTSVILPNSVQFIGDSAFSGNQLTSVVIPNSITAIGDNALSNNPTLTSLTVDMTEIPVNFARNLGITSLTNVIIGDNVISIGGNAFSDNLNLETITVPDGLYDSLTYNCGGTGNYISQGGLLINKSGTNSCTITTQ